LPAFSVRRRVTVLTDGDAGLRAIQQQVLPHAEHVLDWFHISMRFTNLQRIAKGISAIVDGGVRSHALAEIDRAKRRLWNGHTERGIVGLVHLGQWAQARCFDNIPSLKKLAHPLLETIRYLEMLGIRDSAKLPARADRFFLGRAWLAGRAEASRDAKRPRLATETKAEHIRVFFSFP
jgi:hypothetical protein